MSFRIAILTAACLLAACARGGSGFTPSVPAGMLPAPFVQLSATQGEVKIAIAIPKHASPELTPHFVSPSTKSIRIKVYNHTGKTLLATENADLVKTSKECKTSFKGLVCTLAFAVNAGTDLFDATGFDNTGEKGHTLEALRHFPHAVAAGKTTSIPLVLGGLAKSIAIIPPATQAVTGTQKAGFGVIGNMAQAFIIVPRDADGNYIVGPGAPAAKIVKPFPLDVAIYGPSKKEPATWQLGSSFNSATNPSVPKKTSMIVEASPVPNSGGTTVRATVPLNLYQPWIYVADYGSGKVKAFDENGNAKTLTGSFSSLYPSTAYIAYSANDHHLFIDSYAFNAVQVYDLMGNVATASGGFPNTNDNGQLMVDPKTNTVWVPNYLNSTTNYVTEYDLNGNEKTVGASAFSGMKNGSWLMAYDPINDRIYGINYNGGGAGYDASGVSKTGVSGFPNVYEPYGLTIDTKNGLIYVANQSNVTVYDASGAQKTVSGSWSNLPQYSTIEYDPYNDKLYVGACCNHATQIYQYDPEGHQLTLGAGTFSGLSDPMGITVIP